jgi:hypothetical protein
MRSRFINVIFPLKYQNKPIFSQTLNIAMQQNNALCRKNVVNVVIA